MIQLFSNNKFGFTGRLLKINLNKLQIREERINPEYANQFFGGAGYACRYLFDYLKKETDPLSKDNILIIMNGPFCLTSVPSSSRFVVCSKSPYTGLWGESNCGGTFGPELKKAGYDGIIIKGKADMPVIVNIKNQDCEILDATKIWGCGIKETRNYLQSKLEFKNSKILCIGQAGENQVKFANINAEGRSAGRTGMGAVMGAKNLKAITVEGDSFKPVIADPIKFKILVKKLIKYLLNANSTKVLRQFGTSATVLGAYEIGDLPIKYWSKGRWEKINDISGEKLRNNFLLKNKSCYGCLIGCGRIIRINNRKYQINKCEGPEYETIAGFGAMILNNDLESIAIANDLCNDYGLDTISTSGVIAFVFDLFNKGLINSGDLDGIKPKWGSSDSMLKFIKKIAKRDGIGNLLANGSKAIGKKFDINEDHIAIINNLEIPYHDMRYCYGMALTYAFSPRGACHTTADGFKIFRKNNEIDFSSFGIKKIKMNSNDKTMAINIAKLQDYRSIYSSLIFCFFSNPPPSYTIELIKALTGVNFDISNLQNYGERIFNLKRLFNIKMGLTSKNDSIPKILLNPLDEGPIREMSPDFEKLKKYYYRCRNWNPIDGRPNPSLLNKLKLNELKF
jgi:aldehyde:ferredoxin oxidoreductase